MRIAVKVIMSLIVAGFGWVVFFHAYRYLWTLQMIKQNGQAIAFEPDLAMLNFEIWIAWGALGIIVCAFGYIIGKVTR